MDAVGYAVGAPFALLSAVRGRKGLHPDGEVFEGTLAVHGDPAAPDLPLLREAREHRAIVRLSRGLGLPRAMPDFLGLALRLPDAGGPGRHQDVLLVTSSGAPVLHHALVPSPGVQERPYSSVLPFRAAGETVILGALPAGEDRFAIATARPLGRFRPFAELRIGARLPDELDGIELNPFNAGAGLEPAGFVNRLRDYAYPLSQAGRRARHASSSPSSARTSASGSGVAR
jgi:hypothetical protein